MRMRGRSGRQTVPFKSSLVGYTMVFPALALYGIFVLYPLAQTTILSFHKWDGAAKVKEFVGGLNYIQLFKDPVLWVAFRNNLFYAVGVVLLGVFPGLIVAVLLSRRLVGRRIFQAIFFCPRVISLVIVGVVWGWIYNPIFGLLNFILKMVGLGFLSRGWLGDPQIVLFCITVAAAWTYFGFCMVIFLAALQNADPLLYDAARIDGANSLQTFVYVTVPQLKHVSTMLILYTVMTAFQVFDLIYVMTRGGPGNASQIMATYIYRKAFNEIYFGYASCIAVFLLVIVVPISVAYLRYQESRV